MSYHVSSTSRLRQHRFLPHVFKKLNHSAISIFSYIGTHRNQLNSHLDTQCMPYHAVFSWLCTLELRHISHQWKDGKAPKYQGNRNTKITSKSLPIETAHIPIKCKDLLQVELPCSQSNVAIHAHATSISKHRAHSSPVKDVNSLPATVAYFLLQMRICYLLKQNVSNGIHAAFRTAFL